MTRDSSQIHFYNISELLMDKPSSFAHKEMSIFCLRQKKMNGFTFADQDCIGLILKHFADQDWIGFNFIE